MAMGGSLPAAMGDAPAEAVEGTPPAPSPAPKPASRNPAPARSEALSALGNLGYAPGEAAGAVAQAAGEAPDADTAHLIRAALKLLAPKG